MKGQRATILLLALGLRMFQVGAAEDVPVIFRCENPRAQSVTVAGEFNEWNPQAWPLSRNPDGSWSGEWIVPPGRYGYKFVVDGEWVLDPQNRQTMLLDGNENSLLEAAAPAASPVEERAPAAPRTWTSRTGAQVEAKLVGADEKTITLERADGTRLQIALDRLSDEDQSWVRRLTPGPTGAAQTTAPRAESATRPRGVVERYALTARMFSKPDDYFKGPTRRAMQRYYSGYDRLGVDYRPAGYNPLVPLRYKPEEEAASLYVPAAYDGGAAWGVLIHVDPGDGSMIREDWKPVMDKHHLIYACPWGAENGKPDMRRVGLALDTLATVIRDFGVNTNRVFISGLSGGGHIACKTAMVYPEYFHGVISHAAQMYINGHYPYIDMAEFKKIAKYPIRWVVVSGENDQNHLEVLRTAERLDDHRFVFRIFDVPGMGHELANGEWLDKILSWIEGESVEGGVPRFKENGISYKGRKTWE